jgi:hypothetical protein
MLRRVFLACFVAALIAGAGCILITGSTSGYTQATPESGCSSASDCDGGDQVCCFSTTAFVSSCQVAPCGIQLCQKSSECVGVSCVEQSCVLEAGTYKVEACGKIPIPLCVLNDP